MRRRLAAVDERLPLELRTFDPAEWLRDGEDPTDPVFCHAIAPARHWGAVCEAMGIRSAHAVHIALDAIDHWTGGTYRLRPGECPCSSCRPPRRRRRAGGAVR